MPNFFVAKFDGGGCWFVGLPQKTQTQLNQGSLTSSRQST